MIVKELQKRFGEMYLGKKLLVLMNDLLLQI